MAFLKVIEIDFDTIEYQLEEQCKRIDWNDDESGRELRTWIYDVINEDLVPIIENLTYTNQYELIQWIIDRLIYYCDGNDVTILQLDPSGNEILCETDEDDTQTEGEIIYQEHDEEQYQD